MEPKKNPKADLNKRSVLFFQLGLILVLLITWQAIEYKTYDRTEVETETVELDLLEEEDVPITEMLNTPPPPPPPPPAPEVIEVIEDEVEEEEDIIESTETTQEEIVEVRDVQVAEAPAEVIEDVPFTVIENVPVFPGCERYSTNEERKNCMSKKIQEFVDKRFNRNLGSELGLRGVNRIYVTFKIDQNGDIVQVRSRGPHARLEGEAERVINMLPTMTPGKQRGKAVGVLYSLPIVFQVQD